MNAKNYDFDVINTVAIWLEDGPGGIQNDLEDWKIGEKDEKKMLFYKEKNYISKHQDLRQDILKMFHNHKIIRECKHRTQKSSLIPRWLSLITTLHLYTTCVGTYILMWLVQSGYRVSRDSKNRRVMWR